MLRYFIPLLFVYCQALNAQDLQAYQLYNSRGKKVSFEKMATAANQSEWVLFGEFHDNPIAHWLQLELMQKAFLVWRQIFNENMRACCSKKEELR